MVGGAPGGVRSSWKRTRHGSYGSSRGIPRSCNKAVFQHPALSVGQRRVNTGGGTQSTEKKVEAASECRQGQHGQQRLQQTARAGTWYLYLAEAGGYNGPVPGLE